MQWIKKVVPFGQPFYNFIYTFSFLLNKYIIKAAIKNVITYVATTTAQFPAIKLLPAIVDDTIEGNLANVEMSKNFIGFIGNNPPIYTNKSFGVPGIKNSTNSIISSLF